VSSTRGDTERLLLRLIRASFDAGNGIYGSPRVFLDLREAGETCSKHRVARLMRANKLRPVRGYSRKPGSVTKPSEVAPNVLQRQFDGRPNKAWGQPGYLAKVSRGADRQRMEHPGDSETYFEQVALIQDI
jgi:putative transposase